MTTQDAALSPGGTAQDNARFRGSEVATFLQGSAWVVAIMFVAMGILVLAQFGSVETPLAGTLTTKQTNPTAVVAGCALIISGVISGFVLSGLSALVENTGRIRQLLEQRLID